MARKKKRLSQVDWSAVFERWKASGLTQEEFCRAEGVRYTAGPGPNPGPRVDGGTSLWGGPPIPRPFRLRFLDRRKSRIFVYGQPADPRGRGRWQA